MKIVFGCCGNVRGGSGKDKQGIIKCEEAGAAWAHILRK